MKCLDGIIGVLLRLSAILGLSIVFCLLCMLCFMPVAMVFAAEPDPPTLQEFDCYKTLIVSTEGTHPELKWTRGYITVSGSDKSLKDVILSPQFDGRTWIGALVCPNPLHVTYTAIEGHVSSRGARIPIEGMPQSWGMHRVYLPGLLR